MSESSALSKFLTPPSIASFDRHERIVKTILDDSDLAPFVEKQGDSLNATELPLKLQSFANAYSLKPTKTQQDLQAQVDALPHARMAGSPEEANLLCMMLEMMNANIVVEVGVFRGLSTLAFAVCLEGLNKKMSASTRKVVGLDVSEDYAKVGIDAWKQAGVEDMIDFRVGDAKESLSCLLEEEGYGEESVDMCFIDADKVSYHDYYEKCVKLTKSGGLIVVDNTLWGGRVAVSDEVLHAIAKKKTTDKEGVVTAHEEAGYALDTIAIKSLAKRIYEDDRIERVSFLTIADGVTICRKK